MGKLRLQKWSHLSKIMKIIYMTGVVLKCVNLARLRKFLRIPFLIYSRLRMCHKRDSCGRFTSWQEAAVLLLLTHCCWPAGSLHWCGAVARPATTSLSSESSFRCPDSWARCVFKSVTKTLASAGHPHPRVGGKVELMWVLVHPGHWSLYLWVQLVLILHLPSPTACPAGFKLQHQVQRHLRETSSSTCLCKVKSLKKFLYTNIQANICIYVGICIFVCVHIHTCISFTHIHLPVVCFSDWAWAVITMDTACSRVWSQVAAPLDLHTLSSSGHMAVWEGFHLGQTEIEVPVGHLGGGSWAFGDI